MVLLKIKNLKVKAAAEGNKDKKREEILKGINLDIKRGAVHILLGPNGSGKSALVQTVLGNPRYKITSGEIYFKDEKITNLAPEKKTKKGIALAWQNPPNIRGVSFSDVLKRVSVGKNNQSNEINEKYKSILEKEISTNLSGGEKKIAEITQILSLDPELVIFDEIDSGLDMKKVKEIANIIKGEFISKNVAILLITHSGEILDFLKPDTTSVLVNGKIICSQNDHKKILKTINQYGYEKCKKHALSTHKQQN